MSDVTYERVLAARKARRRRGMVIIAAVLVAVLVTASALTVFALRRPLPRDFPNLALPDMHGEATIRRDDLGIPRIFADDARDLFRAQGFAHAQDRFFQMDYRRHVTAGRLSELVGNDPIALESDKVARTLGWRQVAEAEWDLLTPRTQEYLSAYATGVNDYLQRRAPDELGFEYTVLGRRAPLTVPEPWHPVDSLAWLKAVAWEMRANYQQELDRALAYGILGDIDLVNQLFPPFQAGGHEPILAPHEVLSPTPDRALDATTSVPGSEPTSQMRALLRDPEVALALELSRLALSSVPELLGRGAATGSNSWVVSGAHTESGKPLLANDPHLALSTPNVWTQVGLHCNEITAECPFDVAGFSFAGFPGVFVGHNGQLAWGLTNMRADATDFFIERVRGDEVQRGAGWEPIEERTEIINVAGAAPVEFRVRSTARGPLISDVLEVSNALETPTSEATVLGAFAVSLAWTALTPGNTADAVFELNLAATADDIAAAAAMFDVPAQNIVFATTAGDIGFQASGRVPIRGSVPGAPVPADGTWPRDARDAAYDWQGWVPASDLPRALNPESGIIVAANQAITAPGTGPFIAYDWDYGFRSERIRNRLLWMIQDGHALTVSDMQNIQTDAWNPASTILIPALLDINLDSEYDAAGQKLLADWDGYMDRDSAAAAYFAAVWNRVLQTTFWDDLPEAARPDGTSRWLVVVREMLKHPSDPFWDDRSTLGIIESRDEILRQALISARRDLTVRVSKNPDDWSWGALHQLWLEHPLLGTRGNSVLLRRLMNPDPVSPNGATLSINATAWHAASGTLNVISGPSMRMVVDLGDLDNSRWVLAGGTSGHPLSGNFEDQMAAWAQGLAYPFLFTRDAVLECAPERTSFRPQ